MILKKIECIDLETGNVIKKGTTGLFGFYLTIIVIVFGSFWLLMVYRDATSQRYREHSNMEKAEIDKEQTGEFTVFQDRLEREYNQQITLFIDQLKKLSANEFTITAENLMLELDTYDAKFNSYPFIIKAKQPIKAKKTF